MNYKEFCKTMFARHTMSYIQPVGFKGRWPLMAYCVQVNSGYCVGIWIRFIGIIYEWKPA